MTSEPITARRAPGSDPRLLESLAGHAWRVDPRSDRVGMRLVPVETRVGAAMLAPAGPLTRSRPVAPGAIQLPPDGHPIVLGPDAPTLGGYPVVGVVGRDARDRLARLRPGAEVRIKLVR